MKETSLNLFVVNTPHQLLNAIEAVNRFQLKNNHLLVVRPKSSGQDRFKPLIETSEWASVSFPTPFIDGNAWLEKRLSRAASRWYCRYLHFECMLKLSRISTRFRCVDKLFLGHEFAEEKPFMRHIANTIQYNELYLLDDGTDTIEINKRRRGKTNGENHAPGSHTKERPERSFKANYWDWHLDELPSVTFFTIYDLEAREGDRIIKNDYRHLRSLAPTQATRMPDTVVFLGQCIADGYFDIKTHFQFLEKASEYFAGKRLVYVAHPRESVDCINRVKAELGWEIWPSSSVIEQDMIVRGLKPMAIAGVVSSALITLASLMEPDVKIVCFHIGPEHWLGWGEYAVGVYDYLERKARDRIVIAPLSLSVQVERSLRK